MHKNKIKFNALTKTIYNRSYSLILNNKGEMIIGLAHMDSYEKENISTKVKSLKSKYIIFDLNLSLKIINFLILFLSKIL